MLLVIDIGNTNIVLGIFDNDILIKKWRLSTHRENTRDEYSIFLRSLLRDAEIDKNLVTSAAVCSVVPSLTPLFESILKTDLGITPVVVRPGIKTGLVILYEPPQDVGADRIVNSVAGFKKYGGPIIIVDFGTATTFDIVSEKSEYLGGIITPGPAVSAEALSSHTAKLPRVDVRKPVDIIGKNTVGAIRSGLYFGQVGACDRIIKEILDKMDKKPVVVATGGLAEMVAESSEYIDNLEPDLTMEGLKILHSLNIDRKS